jgi:hypothetical protein
VGLLSLYHPSTTRSRLSPHHANITRNKNPTDGAKLSSTSCLFNPQNAPWETPHFTNSANCKK